jgi:alpha-galactosidase
MEEEFLGSTVSRRQVLRTLAAAPAVLLEASNLAGETNLSGYWVLLVPTGDGNYRKSFFELQQSGSSVSGKMMFGQREFPISDGSFKDGNLHFDVVFHFRDQAHKVAYRGLLESGRLAMRIDFPDRSPITGTAERTTRAATLPPKPLPLPPLHDVPDNGLVRTPPMGWNSWNLFAGRVDDAIVRAAADALIASGMHKAGYEYINIDDTWQGPRDRHGNITSNRKFPNMKALASYVHSKGLKIGIYSGPGPTTCAGYTGSFGHEEQDVRTYTEWGFDYLKYDWCSAREIYPNADLRPVYQKMGDALLKAGRPIVYSLCEYGMGQVWTWGSKVGGNLWRTTGDINDTWKRMDQIGFRQFAIAHYAKAGHWNDPDMLEVGNGGMAADEYRTHMSLWCLLAAPLLAGNDLSKMSDETQSILMNRELIAIDQDRAAIPVKLVGSLGTTVVAARQLADQSTAVGLFNRNDHAEEVGVHWSAIGLEGKRLRARDLWTHQSVAVSETHYSAKVPAHGVVMLRVRG